MAARKYNETRWTPRLFLPPQGMLGQAITMHDVTAITMHDVTIPTLLTIQYNTVRNNTIQYLHYLPCLTYINTTIRQKEKKTNTAVKIEY